MLASLPALPVELHLTTAPLNPAVLPRFEALCQQVGGKALLIELARGEYCQQPMLSLVTTTTAAAGLAQALTLARDFGTAGYAVRRIKLEVPAWGAALVRQPASDTSRPYYEWHGRVGATRETELRAWCELHGAHLSINALRQRPGVRFVTLREFGSAACFTERVASLRNGLAGHGWELAKQQAEFCFFDSKEALDAGWLRN
jgi:hypothetical protein